MTGPFGQFYLRPPRRPLLMVAGGTGLAPMLSMLEQLARGGGSDHAVELLYGVNRPEELFAQQQLESLASRGLKLAVARAAVEAGAGWTGATGHVTGLLDEARLNGGECDVYLCGPPPMIDAASRWLHGKGVDPKRVHAERFLPS